MKEPAGKFLSIFQLTDLTGLQFFQLLRYASYVLLGIGFVKLEISAGEIGRFETFILVSGMVSFFWISGIINSMLAVYPKRDEQGKRDVLFNTFISLCLLSVAAGAMLYFFSASLLAFINKGGSDQLIKLAVLYILLNCPSYLNEYVLFLNGRKKAIVSYGVVNAIITLGAGLFPVLLGYGVEGAVYGLLIVAALRLIFSLVLLARYASFNFDYSTIRSVAIPALPLLLSIFVSGSAEYIDGLIVKANFDNVFFAVYRYGARELPVLLIIANTLSTALIPAIATNLNEGLNEIREKSTQLMHIFFPLTIVLMLSSHFLFVHILSGNYYYSALIFNIYLLLIIPRVLFPQTILTGLQRSKFILISALFEIVLNASLSIFLAHRMGLPGVAIGTLVAYLFDKTVLVCVNALVLGIPPWRYVSFAPFAAYSILTLLAFGLSLWFSTL